MTDKPDDKNRRQFLKATGAAALTASIAGCTSGGGGDGEDGGDGGDGTDGSDGTDGGDGGDGEGEDGGDEASYPYSANQTDVESAIQVMEEAGYGPDNRFELDWLQYTSPTWEEMANTIRERLSSAYIDMNISQAGFDSLLSQTEAGNHQSFTLGWIADYPAPQNFLQLVDPPNTVYDAEGATPNGSRLFWDEDSNYPEGTRQGMIGAFDQIQNNAGTSEEAQQARAEAVPQVEEALWESAAMLPVYHRVDELFWYDRVDYDPPGAMGASRAKANVSVQGIEDKDTLDGTSSTFSSLDPVASGNTASGSKIMNMFDAPMNYPNGSPEVEPLLVDDFSVSDDLTTYEFTLKEGVQFHGDYGELTASDMVYSIRRLVESENSSNTYFPNSVLNIVRETDDEGNVVPGSTGVEETGEYSFRVELEEPFSFALSVLAYSAFSAVPEGIVGDIEGYDGDMEWTEFSQNPVGCGPYQFEQWDSGNGGQFRASAFDQYHGQESAVSELKDDIITDPTASYNSFINGNADVSGIPTSQYDPSLVDIETTEGGQSLGTYGPVEDDITFNLAQTPTLNTFYIGFNVREVPTAVRRAMAYVINREQFVDSVFKGRGAAAFHLTPTQIYPGGAEAYQNHWQGN